MNKLRTGVYQSKRSLCIKLSKISPSLTVTVIQNCVIVAVDPLSEAEWTAEPASLFKEDKKI